jgi:hypothetical protein
MPPQPGQASPNTPTQLSPAANAPDPRDTRMDEAYFPDEWGPTKTARRLHVNLFETQGKNGRITATNPLLDSSVATVTELTQSELTKLTTAGHDTKELYRIFVPASASPPFDVTVLFAVGTEIVRHGLRRFFDLFAKQVLVCVPGIEGGWSNAQSVGRAWGVGITKRIIDDLLASAGFSGAAFTVKVLAAYSTGYRGIAGTINNWAGTPTLDLSSVRNVILYDALYRCDEPAPGKGTERALTKIDSVTSNKVRVVVYEVTSGGTPRNGDTRVPQAWLGKTFSGRYGLTNLKPHSAGLFALIYARIFDAAVKDGYLALASLPTSLQNLIAVLPKRGDVASALPPAPFRQLVSNSAVALADWAKQNATDVAAVQKDLDRLRSKVIADGRFQLMGWRPPAVGEILHDGFIQEFAWEFLLG